jgi:hypothetical protein
MCPVGLGLEWKIVPWRKQNEAPTGYLSLPCLPTCGSEYRQTATSSRPVTAFLAACGKDKEFFPVQPDHLFGRFDEAVPIGVIGCVYFRAVQLR